MIFGLPESDATQIKYFTSQMGWRMKIKSYKVVDDILSKN